MKRAEAAHKSLLTDAAEAQVSIVGSGDDIDPNVPYVAGSVPGSPSDGLNYLKFLKSVKSKVPLDKSISITLPASYWYPKEFSVRLMSAVVGKY